MNFRGHINSLQSFCFFVFCFLLTFVLSVIPFPNMAQSFNRNQYWARWYVMHLYYSPLEADKWISEFLDYSCLYSTFQDSLLQEINKQIIFKKLVDRNFNSRCLQLICSCVCVCLTVPKIVVFVLRPGLFLTDLELTM